MTLLLWLVGWETGREVGVILGFHLVGLALELFKVSQARGSVPTPASRPSAASRCSAASCTPRSQESVWTVVHVAKLGSWSLLVVVSIVLVAAVKSYEGRLYGVRRA